MSPAALTVESRIPASGWLLVALLVVIVLVRAAVRERTGRGSVDRGRHGSAGLGQLIGTVVCLPGAAIVLLLDLGPVASALTVLPSATGLGVAGWLLWRRRRQRAAAQEAASTDATAPGPTG